MAYYKITVKYIQHRLHKRAQKTQNNDDDDDYDKIVSLGVLYLAF